MTMPILPGVDGVQKMSKSLANHVGVADAPEEQFGRTMRIPDVVLPEWYRLLAPDAPPPTGHPGRDKRRLAALIAERFHGPGSGAAAEEHFNRVVRDRGVPDEMPSVSVPAGLVHIPALLVDGLGIASRSEARRLIASGGVSLDGSPIAALDIESDQLSGKVLKAGKRRFARLTPGG
jgi:tyrosyl-tRNA synthetase